MEKYLREKREELVWALSEQDYSGAQIARIFGTDRTAIKRIIDSKPEDYKTKWVKIK